MNIDQLPEWDNYSDPSNYEIATDNDEADPDNDEIYTDNDETKSDGIERPPLTGKNRYVPNGLYEQPWDHVGDAYGKATLTPYYIEALTSDDEDDVSFGAYWLYAATTHQGSVYKASRMAIPFLVDIMHLNNDASELACHFLARIALGENHFIPTPAYFYKTKFFSKVQKYQNDILAYYERHTSAEHQKKIKEQFCI